MGFIFVIGNPVGTEPFKPIYESKLPKNHISNFWCFSNTNFNNNGEYFGCIILR